MIHSIKSLVEINEYSNYMIVYIMKTVGVACNINPAIAVEYNSLNPCLRQYIVW